MTRTADHVIKFGEIVFDWSNPNPDEVEATVHALCHDCGQTETLTFHVSEVEAECANVSATHDQVCDALD